MPACPLAERRRLPTQVAEWVGHGVDVLLRIYAKCVVGQDELAKRRSAKRYARTDIEAHPRSDLGFGHVLGTESRR